jgi:hypothetical protein
MKKSALFDFLMSGGFEPKAPVRQKKEFRFFFSKKEIAFPAAMSRGDFDTKFYFIKRFITIKEGGQEASNKFQPLFTSKDLITL